MKKIRLIFDFSWVHYQSNQDEMIFILNKLDRKLITTIYKEVNYESNTKEIVIYYKEWFIRKKCKDNWSKNFMIIYW